MKLNKLALAVAAIVAAPAAFAHSPTTAPDLTVSLSGASAQQGNLVAIAEKLMVAGTIDVFYNDAAGSNHRAVFGTIKPTGTVVGGVTIDSKIGGKKVLLLDRAQGGSFQGVGPVARSQSIAAMSTTGCTSSGLTYPSPTYYCGNTVNLVPDAGVSDVEPAMFRGANLPTGETALSAAELAGMDVASQNAVIMGLAVTNNYTLPSISKAAVQSIMSGSYTDWSQVDPSLSGPIVLETRTAGSGTKAMANAWYLNNPCSTAGLTPLGNQGDPVNFSTFTVVENASTGGVKSGLNAVYSKGMMGIGIISLENTPAANDNWHFVAIDGVAPTVANAINGSYTNFTEQSMQWRAADNASGNATVQAKNAFLQAFRATSADPSVLSTLPGVAATAFVYDPTSPYVGIMLKGTRAGVTGPSTCQPVQMFY